MTSPSSVSFGLSLDHPVRDFDLTSVVEISSTGELLSLTEAKDHLRIRAAETRHDAKVSAHLAGARQWCEQAIYRTFRTEVVNVLTLEKWPPRVRGYHRIDIPRPPVINVEAVRYHDENDTLQVMTGSQFTRLAPTYGQGCILLSSVPTVASRPDAIFVEYKAGYATMPPAAVDACKLILSTLMDDDRDERNLKAAQDRAQSLLDGLAWGRY